MPYLDTSMVLDDPMFNDKFQIRRTKRTGFIKGRVQYEYEIIDTDGVITSIPAEHLNRIPQADRARSPKYVYCKQKLQLATKDYAPDEIIFDGSVWQVTDVNDWSKYGKGFYRALVIQKDPTARE